MTECTIDMNESHDNAAMRVRREKLMQWREVTQAFPNHFKRCHLALPLHEQYHAHTNEQLEAEPVSVTIAGRIMMQRLMGKASFLSLQDMSGRMQVYLKQEWLSAELFEETKKWDIGDIVGVRGTLFQTKTGELTVRVDHIELLTKALRPLPDKYHGLQDQEIKYRQRYVDLIMDEKTRHVFTARIKLIQALREFFIERQFLEVETPMMQVLAGGANAKPFTTHHNALDIPLFLRISPELYLKRLVVGGFERVFEINRNFRNEGLSTRHNPEFTMIEFYQAYADYTDLMDLTEELFRTLAQKVMGTLVISYAGRDFDLSKPFTRLSVKEAVKKYNPTFDVTKANDRDYMVQFAKQLHIKPEDSWGTGKILIEIFDATAESSLEQPTFITEYPTEISPLARKNDKDPTITDRFELFICGREIANGFSELNDPEDQAARLRAQADEKAQGDEEAMIYDADYVTALEYGLPPTAGEGIGIDRLVMFFTDSHSIKDVILFPHMKPLD